MPLAVTAVTFRAHAALHAVRSSAYPRHAEGAPPFSWTCSIEGRPRISLRFIRATCSSGAAARPYTYASCALQRASRGRDGVMRGSQLQPAPASSGGPADASHVPSITAVRQSWRYADDQAEDCSRRPDPGTCDGGHCHFVADAGANVSGAGRTADRHSTRPCRACAGGARRALGVRLGRALLARGPRVAAGGPLRRLLADRERRRCRDLAAGPCGGRCDEAAAARRQAHRRRNGQGDGRDDYAGAAGPPARGDRRAL